MITLLLILILFALSPVLAILLAAGWGIFLLGGVVIDYLSDLPPMSAPDFSWVVVGIDGTGAIGDRIGTWLGLAIIGCMVVGGIRAELKELKSAPKRRADRH
jgi:hypothetical protein